MTLMYVRPFDMQQSSRDETMGIRKNKQTKGIPERDYKP